MLFRLYARDHVRLRNDDDGAFGLPGRRRRVDQPDLDLLGDFPSLGSSSCYLVDVEKIHDTDNKRVWRKPTPPNVPPGCFLLRYANGQIYHTDSGGGPLLPFEEGITPAHIYLRLEGPRGTLIRSAKVVCYDLIADCRRGINCPNVEDANVQYPHMHFEETGTSLGRFLKFPASNNPEKNPFQRFSESEWTSDAYDKQEAG
jgi:hypothetical protein